MGTLTDFINNTRIALADKIGAPLLMRAAGTLESASSLVSAIAGANGGLTVEAVDIPTKPTAITASDTTDTTLTTAKGVLVGGAGNLIVKGRSGTQVTIAVVAGQFVPLQCTRVMAATSATGIVGLS